MSSQWLSLKWKYFGSFICLAYLEGCKGKLNQKQTFWSLMSWPQKSDFVITLRKTKSSLKRQIQNWSYKAAVQTLYVSQFLVSHGTTTILTSSCPHDHSIYILIADYYGLNVVSPQNSYTEILTPKVMILGGEVFGKLFVYEDYDLIIGISVSQPFKQLACLLHHVTRHKTPSMNQEMDPFQTSDL